MERKVDVLEEKIEASLSSSSTAAIDSISLGLARKVHEAGMEWSYRDKLIMAPMVRISSLPMRMLAYSYGADICYSEEMIDRKIIKTIRKIDPITGRIEYHLPAGGITFATYPNEPVVMQLGTADAVLALKAAQTVCNDVRAIDINMGCPKHFSLQGGMGAALLSKPELVHDILSTLTRNLTIPVTCKIRLLEKHDDTMRLVKAAESAGIAAIAIHARHIADRPRNPARISDVPAVISQLTVPSIYNGDVFYYDDIARVKKQTGCSSVMIARGAQWNPSVFRSAGMLPVYDVCNDYIAMSTRVGNVYANSKYAILEMLKGHVGPVPQYQSCTGARDFGQLRAAVKGVADVAAVLTRGYVAPLAASLIAEMERKRLRTSSSGDRSSITSDSNDMNGASGTATTSSIVTSTRGEKRKRRRQKKKDKRTQRTHTKFLRIESKTETKSASNTADKRSPASPTVNGVDTLSSSSSASAMTTAATTTATPATTLPTTLLASIDS